jgi:hypothetical protein
LRGLVESTLAKTGGRVYTTRQVGALYKLQETTFSDASQLGTRELYLGYPEAAETGLLASTAGLPQIWLPVVSSDSISMAVLSILIEDKHKRGHENRESRDSAVLFEALRRRFNAVMTKGVVGRNCKTGAEQLYDDILISEGAIKLANRGTTLKNQFGDGFVTFYARR